MTGTGKVSAVQCSEVWQAGQTANQDPMEGSCWHVYCLRILVPVDSAPGSSMLQAEDEIGDFVLTEKSVPVAGLALP